MRRWFASGSRKVRAAGSAHAWACESSWSAILQCLASHEPKDDASVSLHHVEWLYPPRVILSLHTDIIHRGHQEVCNDIRIDKTDLSLAVTLASANFWLLPGRTWQNLCLELLNAQAPRYVCVAPAPGFSAPTYVRRNVRLRNLSACHQSRLE